MKIFNCKKNKISRKFLIAASAYRRMAADWNVDFSLSALKEQYAHETYGDPAPDESKNGYTLGKKWLGVQLAAMKEDYREGLFTKVELCEGSCAFIRREISLWPPVDNPFFGML